MRVEIKKVFFATDISDFSNHSISWGIALAQEFGAKLYVCHVVDFPTSITYGDGPIFFMDQQDLAIGNAHKQLKQLIGEAQIEWEPLVTIGHAADEISRLVGGKGCGSGHSADPRPIRSQTTGSRFCYRTSHAHPSLSLTDRSRSGA